MKQTQQEINNNKDNTQIWFNQFKFDEVYSDFSDFIDQTGQLLKSNELILKKIDQDLDRYGREKKKQRNQDQQFIFEQTQALDDFSQIDADLSIPKDTENPLGVVNKQLIVLYRWDCIIPLTVKIGHFYP